ncbi:MAG TPA: alanine--glyoxylate aminotransferase family protein [Anaerolineae bacterium]|nr:alanine--glyoxylate aminotransferase family protein [Anaerolineae bacterium]
MNLRIPGPVTIPQEILDVMDHQMIDHRGPQFAAIQARVVKNLQTCFQTKNDVLLFTSSGTGGLESAIVNTLSPGDPVLAFVAGEFGERIAAIAATYGSNVTKIKFENGQGIDPDRVAQELKNAPQTKAVLVTHNETSTGIMHPLKEISHAVRANSDAVLIVDGVSSMLTADAQVDNWGIDVMVSASQKAWACPPGVAIVSISDRAWKAHANAKMPRFYFDWTETKKWLEKGQTPFTPAVSVYYALDLALERILEEGLPNVFARHAHIAALTREQAKQLGFRMFGDERYASNAVTALYAPDGVDTEALRKAAREEYDLIIGGGQGPMRGKIIRIGHLGWVKEQEIYDCFAAIGHILEKVAA